MKRRHSSRVDYHIGRIEGGIVTGSKHPVNNIYLRCTPGKGRRNGIVDMEVTVDEAAAIIHVLSGALLDFTTGKRDILTPK